MYTSMYSVLNFNIISYKLLSIKNPVNYFIFFGLLFFNDGICQSDTVSPSLKDKNIIFVYGGMKGHSPKESADLFIPILEKEGANVKVYDNFNIYEDPVIMKETDLIIQAFTSAFTPEDQQMNDKQFKGLQIAILNGTGFSGWHGGIGDSNPLNRRYQFMVGGHFIAHPGNMTNFEVKIIDNYDPITRNISNFLMNYTEQYYMLIDPNIKVLAVSQFTNKTYKKLNAIELEKINYINIDVANDIKGSVMPVIWKKNYGKGRIFYSSIGHYLTDFDVPEVMTIQMRGFRWASEGKYSEKEKTITPIYMK